MIRAALALAAGALLALPVLAQPSPAAARMPTVTRLVKLFSELENDLVAQAHASEPQALDAMLDPGFEMRLGAQPGVPVPRDDWMHAVRAAPREAARIDQMAVHDFGTIAVVSFRQTPTSDASRTTPRFVVDCWKRAGDGWKLAVRFVSDATSSGVKTAKPPKTIEKRY
jgi:hypothetical protein